MTSTDRVPASGGLRVVPQQARGREKIARLLSAADGLLATEGADAVTTVRVAAAAGVSVGSLYRYLPNREAIIEALAREYLGELEELAAVLVDQVSTAPVDDIVGLSVDAFADFYRSHPGFRALWFSRHVTDEARALDREHKATMAFAIQKVLNAQAGSDADAVLLPVAQAVHLATDALIQEAFRLDPAGSPALLEQAKVMMRNYIGDLNGR